MEVRQWRWRPWESDLIKWGKDAFVDIYSWLKKRKKKEKRKKKRHKKRPAEKVVEKEWVIGGEVDNVHKPVVEYHVYVEKVVGPLNVVKGSKTFEWPANGFHRVVILNLLLFD